jgi:23S rRNA pseudouridine2605 synthase
MSVMRLQRFLAQAGVASRRKSEELITAGEVRVNGRVVTELGTKVDPDRDRVSVGDRTLTAEAPVYILLHKPKGYVTTAKDPEGRPTVIELVRAGARVFAVGRLDYNTEGVLLLTNDGDLANGLMHPRGEVEKTYHVKLRGHADDKQLQQLAAGVTLDDGAHTAPARVGRLGETDRNDWIELTVHEGMNRQVHRMVEAVGMSVLKLKRVRYAGLELGDVKLGRWRRLMGREVEMLYRKARLKLKSKHIKGTDSSRSSRRPQRR